MPSVSIATVLQLIVGLGLLNVWLVRARSATSYRGGNAKNLQQEFAEYGLPPFAFYLVGALKIGAGIALIAGIWYPPAVLPAAAVVGVLMIGALAMHLKVKDPTSRSVPAFLMLLMSAALVYLSL